MDRSTRAPVLRYIRLRSESSMKAQKILRGFSETVWQVRADDPSGTYRAMYVTQLGEAIYVLHTFQKKSKSGIATPAKEINLIRQRPCSARRLAGK